MKKSLFKLFGVAAITWSTQVTAAGIGGINVLSALGQTLKADIELVSVDKSEKPSLVARLATPDAYKNAGIDFPFGNKFKFTIESRADGSPYIHATSAQPINDPYVNLLLEVAWSSGKVSREFTFLLDPLGYQAEQPAVTVVQTLAPVSAPVEKVVPTRAEGVTNDAVEESIVAEVVPVTHASTKPIKEKIVREKPAKVNTPPVEKEMATGDITVQRGDTLNKIAAENKVEGVSLERMLIALYRVNADQFDNKNMNRIKTGKILRLPDAQELAALSQAEAKSEINAQVSDWNSYRQKLASAPSASLQQQAPQQVSSGKVSSIVADKAPVAKETAKEVLKLSKGDVTTDKAPIAGKAAIQDKKNAAQEEAIAKSKALEEEKTRTALLEKNLQDMKHLAELKTQAAALVKQPVVVSAVVSAVVAIAPVSAVQNASAVLAASTVVNTASDVVAVSAVSSASQVVAVSGVQPALPKPKPKTIVVQTDPADEMLTDPLLLGGGAAALLGLGGLAFVMNRRKQKNKKNADSAEVDFGATTTRITAPEIPSPDTGDFTVQAANTASLSPLPSDDDPISEADLFLSFGRDAQAEEILKEALQNSPNKMPVKLKLLEIYAGRKDANSFEAIAASVQTAGDPKAWQQVVSMATKFDAHNPLYNGDGSIEVSDSATMQTSVLSAPPDLSMDLSKHEIDFANLKSQQNQIFSDVDINAVKSTVMDFDVTATNPGLLSTSGMDFDITASHANIEADVAKPVPALSMDDLIFDITATHPPMPAAISHEKTDEALPFLLDFPLESATPESNIVKSTDFNLDSINLNLDSEVAAIAGATHNEQWHEVATKLDLAKAYQEMGDAGGVREILDEVMQEGDAEQRAAAQVILQQLG